jgi:ATP adenylyltransferase
MHESPTRIEPGTEPGADSPMEPPIRPESLPALLARRTREALEAGALRPIATREVRIEDAGVAFLVRQVDSLARKREVPAPGESPRPVNPFLPPEPLLTLGPLSATHLAVLNKFNVLRDHLLILTRRFEDQETLLGPADFAALRHCLQGIDGLGFYNGGVVAGASQVHKHLQLVPLPLASEGPGVPMESVLAPGATGVGPPFRHALAPLEWDRADAWALERVYRDLLGRLGIGQAEGGPPGRQSAPYNLLVTRRWMLAVPRVAECVDGVSINALGFAGSLFVKDGAALAAIRRRGPMAVLCAAAGDAPPGASPASARCPP